MTTIADHDAYIAAAPEIFQPSLKRLRSILARTLPEAEETVAYNMPGFRIGGSIVAGYLVDEFAMQVREHVQSEGVELVVIDSISGFELAMQGENVRQRLHAFAKSLVRYGVTVILVNETEGLTSQQAVSQRDISYLSDNVIYLRYRQEKGAYHKVVGVLKKRLSSFDSQARTLEVVPGAIRVGAPTDGA